MKTLTHLLGEFSGSALVVDLVQFGAMTHAAEPAEIGLWLSGFYLHASDVIEAEGGRIVKFVGDGVLASFIGADHRRKALAAAAALASARPGWLASAARARMPPLDYTVGVASGPMLHGEIGTDRTMSFDVLGPPVALAFRLATLAQARGVGELLDESTALEPHAGAVPTIEVAGGSFGGPKGGPLRRLFSLADALGDLAEPD